jgi:hypothetical protein
MKNFASGVTIAAAIIGVWFLFRIVWVLAALFMPLIFFVVVLYFLGYYAPKEWHDAAEKQIRKFLDWMDFKAPAWTWPWVRRAREGLDWLGLHVKTS